MSFFRRHGHHATRARATLGRLGRGALVIGIDDKWSGDGRTNGAWRETKVRFEGPAVRQLQAAFAAAWTEAQGVRGTPDAVHHECLLCAGCQLRRAAGGSRQAWCRCTDPDGRSAVGLSARLWRGHDEQEERLACRTSVRIGGSALDKAVFVNSATPMRASPPDVVGRMLRSVTSVTGALAGGLGVAVPLLAATFYEMTLGRPSSTTGLAVPVALILGGIGAGLGAAVGAGIHQMVARTRWAGPMDPRTAAILLMAVVTVPSVLAIQAARRMEAANTPRVIRSTGEVSRAEGWSELAPERSATFLWVSAPHPDHPTGELRWNGRRVDVRVADDRLLVSADERQTAAIDISHFDYARETYGVTAALSPAGQEWLALLVQLRLTSGRDLLFIFNPEGVLVHEELLDRHRGRATPVGLGAAGPAGGPQEIVLDRGVPIRYHASAQ